MKTCLLHFSDIHISNQEILFRIKAIYAASKSIINKSTNVFIVITGDIANHGLIEEYKIAKRFLEELETLIRTENTGPLRIKYIIVPGNHDCCFDNNEDIRNLIIENHKYSDDISSEEFINEILKPQKNFWDFYSEIVGTKNEGWISKKIQLQLSIDCNLNFKCYNTALFSKIEESVGNLIVPKSHYILESSNKNDIDISLFHHNTGWLSSSTKNNNKRLFETHLFKTSDIVMCGHEHSSDSIVKTNINNGEELIYLEGNALLNGTASNFNLISIDTNSNRICIKELEYCAEEMIYKTVNESDRHINKNRNSISINERFRESLDRIDVPIKHPNKKDLLLSDIFIYPDLEPILGIEEAIQYIDASELLNNQTNYPIVMIQGIAQCGSTSLLRTLCKEFIDKDYYPILLEGKDIKSLNEKECLKKVFKEQYNYKEFSFDNYMQKSRDKHIILIDSLNDSQLNNQSLNKFLENLSRNFGQIIITTEEKHDIKSLLPDDKNSTIKKFKLLNFGYLKRNSIIEKWLRLGKDTCMIDEDAIEQEVKLLFDQITNLLGEQLIPSYPIYILTLLQGLSHNFNAFDISQTSYAYCYQSLLIVSLARASVPSDNIQGVINFLTELAYYMFKNNVDSMNYKSIEKFYISYEDKYNITYRLEKIIDILCLSNIIKFEEDNIIFSYKYIFYFLIAKKISKTVHVEEGYNIIKTLCKQIHKEKEANILIFITHHCDNNRLIEELIYSSMLPFENFNPITLNKDDELFSYLNKMVDEIKTDILIGDVDHHETRKNQLEKHDSTNKALSKSNSNNNGDDDFDNQNLIDLTQTYKVIRILGQIVKNQKEVFEKEKITALIKEAYISCFRSVSFFMEIINQSKPDIIAHLQTIIENKNIRDINQFELKEKVNKLLTFLLYKFCLSSFSNLSLSVGTAKMEEIFNSIAIELNTPAAKIISFTINTYYGNMKIAELKRLVQEFQDNPVALHILKLRVLNYVYNNAVSYDKKQAIGEICNMKIINKKQLTNKH